MIVSFVVAVADDNAIGKNNELPWHLPADLKFFKQTTLGKPIIMGRKTFQSLGRPLPGRLNIVLTRAADFDAPEGVVVYNTLSQALAHANEAGAAEACIIGGGEIFAHAMDIVDRMYLTRVHTTVPGAEAFFPVVDHTHWKLVWEEAHEADEKNSIPYTFQQFERIEL